MIYSWYEEQNIFLKGEEETEIKKKKKKHLQIENAIGKITNSKKGLEDKLYKLRKSPPKYNGYTGR